MLKTKILKSRIGHFGAGSTRKPAPRKGIVSRCHRGGRMRNINAWYLNTHMVYL